MQIIYGIHLCEFELATERGGGSLQQRRHRHERERRAGVGTSRYGSVGQREPHIAAQRAQPLFGRRLRGRQRPVELSAQTAVLGLEVCAHSEVTQCGSRIARVQSKSEATGSRRAAVHRCPQVIRRALERQRIDRDLAAFDLEPRVQATERVLLLAQPLNFELGHRPERCDERCHIDGRAEGRYLKSLEACLDRRRRRRMGRPPQRTLERRTVQRELQCAVTLLSRDGHAAISVSRK